MASTFACVVASHFALSAALSSTPGSGKLWVNGHGVLEVAGAVDAASAEEDVPAVSVRLDEETLGRQVSLTENGEVGSESGQSEDDDCLQTTGLLYGTEEHREQYAWVCCDNEHMAENSGFQDDVDFWEQLAADPRASNGGEFTFYDAQCGLPLYVAPRGRSFAAWREESEHHGWPSFRDAERVDANLVEHDNGEIVSTCGTHLGHNLPDGENRHCINLICVAGAPFGNNTADTQRSASK